MERVIVPGEVAVHLHIPDAASEHRMACVTTPVVIARSDRKHNVP